MKNLFWIANLLVVVACAIFAGRAAMHFVAAERLIVTIRGHDPRIPPLIPPRPSPRIAARNIFCSGCFSVVDGPTRTTLPIELVATMLCLADPRWSMAVITAGGEPRLYDAGRTIAH